MVEVNLSVLSSQTLMYSDIDDIIPVSFTEIKEPCCRLTNTNAVSPLVSEIQSQSHLLPRPQIQSRPLTRTQKGHITLPSSNQICFLLIIEQFPVKLFREFAKSVTQSFNLWHIYVPLSRNNASFLEDDYEA